MTYFMLILPLGVFLLIAYFALSKRSSPLLRKTAIITLILLVLAVVICLLLIVNRPPEEPEAVLPVIVPQEAPAKPPKINWGALIAVILFFLGIVLAAILRERRKSLKNNSLEAPR
jgi:ABC-type Fe3+ transport system permease subunit